MSSSRDSILRRGVYNLGVDPENAALKLNAVIWQVQPIQFAEADLPVLRSMLPEAAIDELAKECSWAWHHESSRSEDLAPAKIEGRLQAVSRDAQKLLDTLQGLSFQVSASLGCHFPEGLVLPPTKEQLKVLIVAADAAAAEQAALKQKNAPIKDREPQRRLLEKLAEVAEANDIEVKTAGSSKSKDKSQFEALAAICLVRARMPGGIDAAVKQLVKARGKVKNKN